RKSTAHVETQQLLSKQGKMVHATDRPGDERGGKRATPRQHGGWLRSADGGQWLDCPGLGRPARGAAAQHRPQGARGAAAGKGECIGRPVEPPGKRSAA